MTTTAMPAVEQLRVEIEEEVKGRYEAKFVKEITDFKQKMQFDNDKALKDVIDEFKKSQTPPTQEEIAKLLSQEYLTFNVEVPWESETSTAKTRTFVIRELPQSVEKKFYRKFKEELIPRASDLGALTFDMLEGDVGKKIVTLLETLDPGFDLMADACVMILNPRGKEKDITIEWVQDNLSSYRQWNIINAQVQINRLRDFFSQISRGFPRDDSDLGTSAYPELAAVASWVETFQMPFYEIEERFTKSDLGVIGWRSQETSHQMSLKMKQGNAAAGPSQAAQERYNDGKLPSGLPEKFFNSDGELDLRQVTGMEALKFLHMQGINVPFIPSAAQKQEE